MKSIKSHFMNLCFTWHLILQGPPPQHFILTFPRHLDMCCWGSSIWVRRRSFSTQCTPTSPRRLFLHPPVLGAASWESMSLIPTGQNSLQKTTPVVFNIPWMCWSCLQESASEAVIPTTGEEVPCTLPSNRDKDFFFPSEHPNHLTGGFFFAQSLLQISPCEAVKETG